MVLNQAEMSASQRTTLNYAYENLWLDPKTFIWMRAHTDNRVPHRHVTAMDRPGRVFESFGAINVLNVPQFAPGHVLPDCPDALVESSHIHMLTWGGDI